MQSRFWSLYLILFSTSVKQLKCPGKMEDSLKRAERLMALRATAGNSPEQADLGQGPTPGGLCNPLVDDYFSSSGQTESKPTSRFDYYTDPLAAFSGTKNSGTSGATIPVINQMQRVHNNSFYNPRLYQYPRPFQPQFRASMPFQQGNPQVRGGFSGTGIYRNHGEVTTSTNMGHHGKSIFEPVSNLNYSNRNDAVGPYGNRSYHSTRVGSSHSPRGGHRSHNFQHRGGRGRGFPCASSEMDESLGTESFYHKTMVEDPWQHMEPVLWKELDSHPSNSWLPKSVTAKKPKVSGPIFKPTSGQSLAEYLASSFHEAVNDNPNQ